MTGAPQDAEGVEGANANDWVRRGGLGIKEGAAVATADSVYLGFGLEGVSGATTRNDVVDRVPDEVTRLCLPRRFAGGPKVAAGTDSVPAATFGPATLRPQPGGGAGDQDDLVLQTLHDGDLRFPQWLREAQHRNRVLAF